MALSFFPFYFRNWTGAGTRNPPEQEFELQENVDEADDWVLVDYKNDKSEDGLLKDYVVIDEVRKVSEVQGWLDIGEMVTGLEGSQKMTRNSQLRAKRRADRNPPYHRIPFKFAKLPADRVPARWMTANVPPVPAGKTFTPPKTSSISGNTSIERLNMEKCIVPYKTPLSQQTNDVLKLFQDLSKKTTTANICCDFALLSSPDTCVTRYLLRAQHSNVCQGLRNRMDCVATALDRNYVMISGMTSSGICINLGITSRDRHCVNFMSQDTKCMCSIAPRGEHVTRSRRRCPPMAISHKEPEENDQDKMFACVDLSTFAIFSLNASKSVFSRLHAARNRVDEVLSSILVLHLLLGEKLHALKRAAVTNITEFNHATSLLSSHEVAGRRIDRKSYLTLPVKPCVYTNVFKPNVVYMTTKQLRRMNRTASGKTSSNSNRQRGMKNGRFQNNVGHRESWR